MHAGFGFQISVAQLSNIQWPSQGLIFEGTNTKAVRPDRGGGLLSFIDPERGGFGVIFPEVMIFSEGLCPEKNIITEGNITPNPPSGGSINDILYRKLKNSLSSE